MATHPTKKKPGAKKGRPSDYTPAMGLRICQAFVKWGSLTKACEKEKDLPSRDTIHTWRLDGNHKDFSDAYAQARIIAVEDKIDQIYDISDEMPLIKQHVSTKVVGSDEEAEVEITELEKVDGAAIQRNRLRIDTIKWAAAKIAPKLYGEKVEVGATDSLAAVLASLAPPEGK